MCANVCENKICNFILTCQQIQWRTGARDTVASPIDSLCVYVRENFWFIHFGRSSLPCFHPDTAVVITFSETLRPLMPFFLFYHHLAVFCFLSYHLLYRCLLFTSLVTGLSFSISISSLISPSAFIWCALFPCPPLCPSQLLSVFPNTPPSASPPFIH